MRKARNSLHREVDRSNRMSMTEEGKRGDDHVKDNYIGKKEANAMGMCLLSLTTKDLLVELL
ncbi:hypothetical protein Sjap_013670 [Stephania japonica]|uniref:Uncharacterized protein n=1 Tax=Stephania japonica TaxID=461633 RepID=A0AAP0J052_9MAGN